MYTHAYVCRCVQMKFNIAAVLLNGGVISLYMYIAHNLGHPSWFFVIYLIIVFFSAFVQVACAFLFVLRIVFGCIIGIIASLFRDLRAQTSITGASVR
jgi:hypothetical protein